LSKEFNVCFLESTFKNGSVPPVFLRVERKSFYSKFDLLVFLKNLSKFFEDLVPLRPVDPILLTNLSTDFSVDFSFAAS